MIVSMVNFKKTNQVCPLWRFARALEAIKVRVQLKRYIFCNRRFPVQYPRLYGVKLEYLNIFKAPIKKSRKKIPHTIKIVWFLCCRRLLSELGQGVYRFNSEWARQVFHGRLSIFLLFDWHDFSSYFPDLIKDTKSACWNKNVILSAEIWVYSYFEKGCRKKCALDNPER